MGTVTDEFFHLQFGVKFLKHAACDLHACQYALFLHNQALAPHGVVGDAAQRCGVTITDVLGKG